MDWFKPFPPVYTFNSFADSVSPFSQNVGQNIHNQYLMNQMIISSYEPLFLKLNTLNMILHPSVHKIYFLTSSFLIPIICFRILADCFNFLSSSSFNSIGTCVSIPFFLRLLAYLIQYLQFHVPHASWLRQEELLFRLLRSLRRYVLLTLRFHSTLLFFS